MNGDLTAIDRYLHSWGWECNVLMAIVIYYSMPRVWLALARVEEFWWKHRSSCQHTGFTQCMELIGKICMRTIRFNCMYQLALDDTALCWLPLDRRVWWSVFSLSVVQYGDTNMVFRQNPVCGTDNAYNVPRLCVTVNPRQGMSGRHIWHIYVGKNHSLLWLFQHRSGEFLIVYPGRVSYLENPPSLRLILER